MMPMEIASGIYDVGATDWIVRDFHGYKTERGASYNSYLIVDEKICLIDTVKACYADELLDKIKNIEWNSIKPEDNKIGGRFDFSI